MSLDFLLEIGTEEIPHWMIPGALEQLAKIDLFGRRAASGCDAAPAWWSAPRACRSARRSQSRSSKVRRVRRRQSAPQGFAKKQGVETISTIATQSGDYYELPQADRRPRRPRHSCRIAARRDPRHSVAQDDVLDRRQDRPAFHPADSLDRRAARRPGHPVRNRRRQERQRHARSSQSWARRRSRSRSRTYESELRKNFVILSADERRQKIDTEVTQLGAKPDADLVETLTFITEYPTAIRGDFDPAYLELPAEVLTTVMRHHQKYFSVEIRAGQARAALRRGDEHQRRSRRPGPAAATSECCEPASTTRASSGMSISRRNSPIASRI